MAKQRISNKILIALRKKFPNKTDKELLVIRRNILRKAKVGDVLKKPTEECFRRTKKEFIRETTQKVFESLQLIKFTYGKKDVLNEEKTEILVNPKQIELQRLLNNATVFKSEDEDTKYLRWVDYERNIYVIDGTKKVHYWIAKKAGLKKYDSGGVLYKINKEPLIERPYLRKREEQDWLSGIFMNLKYFEALDESLQLVKFTYNNYKHDKHPKVKVLDYKYKGQPHQKTYGKRDDLLGWNINAYSNKKYAEKAIDDIDSFSRMLSTNKKEKYKRIKHFFPAQSKLLRRYIRKHIVNLKYKPGKLFWKGTNFNDLIKFDKESY